MNELRPLKDDDAALDAEERRLLRAGLGMGVPQSAKRAVWVALASQLPGVAAASTATTATALTTASLVKYGVAGVLLGATTVTTVALVRSPGASPGVPAAAPATAAPAPPPAPVEPPRAEPPRVEEVPSVASVAPVVVAPPSVAPLPPPAAPVTLDTEARRVAAARSLVRAGRTREALAALDALSRDLPHGELVQEREALAIEALLTLGERAEARRRAMSFLERYPNSPHASAARRALP